MATVEVDVDMSMFNTDDLIEELEDRKLKQRHIDKLRVLTAGGSVIDSFLATNLDEQLKLELFKEIVNVFSFSELEKRLR